MSRIGSACVVVALACAVQLGCAGGSGGEEGPGETVDATDESGDTSIDTGTPVDDTGVDTTDTDTPDTATDTLVDTAAPKCTTSAACADSGKGGVCDTTTGACVECTPSEDTCGPGKFCVAATKTCASGCTADSSCLDPSKPKCDTASHICVACLDDSACDAGKVCDPTSKACVSGCSPTKACPTGQTCCGTTCHDLASDVAACGACDKTCTTIPGAEASCVGSACKTTCFDGLADCDGDLTNGCEHSTSAGACVCTPGAVVDCYEGAAGTKDVGLCKGGKKTCAPSGLGYGDCVGQVVPVDEVCANGLDDNCDGVPDNVLDLDGDGWTRCNGDCCDSTKDGCSDPKLVNPGAYEFVGNGLDDDCDPATSDTTPVASCSTAPKLTGVTPTDAARAMELCQTTTAAPALPLKKWGLINAQWLLANGTVPNATQLANMQNFQGAILDNYGTGGTVPTKNSTMLGLSTGHMRDQGDVGYVNPNNGTDFGVSSAPPAAYLAAHAGNLPATAGCSGACPSGTGAHDPINLRLQIRVPTNAKSFSYDLRYFTAEYWTYSCTAYNDFFLALLSSSATGIPADKNISFDSKGNPLSVNNGFFESCVAKGCYTCPLGAGPLAGTGLQLSNTGGGTKWLTTSSPIVPGETITLDLTIFDVSDGILDSNVLLDNFRWSLTPSSVVTN